MYRVVSDDDTKVSAAKEINISIEFNEYEDVLFNEKKSGTKWKDFKVENMKLVLMMSTKYHCHVLMIKDTF